MQKIGVTLTAIGWIVMLLVVSTDDYYVMELREAHTMDWRTFFIAFVVSLIGVLIYRIWDGEDTGAGDDSEDDWEEVLR